MAEGFQRRQFHGRLHGFLHRSEENQGHAAVGGQRHDLQFRRDNRRQGAFAARQHVDQIARLAHGPREAVARPALGQAGAEPVADLDGVEHGHVFHQLTLSWQAVLSGTDFQQPAVAKDDLELVDVLTRVP